MFKKQIPSWVEEMENPMDVEVLKQLCIQGKKPLETPREINFAIVELPKLSAAQNAVIYLEQNGWSCQICQDKDIDPYYWIEAIKQGYVLERERLIDDMRFFERIANMYGGVYDGWNAELV